MPLPIETEAERERYFHYTFYLIFRIISTYLVLTEKQQSEGRADCIIETTAVHENPLTFAQTPCK